MHERERERERESFVGKIEEREYKKEIGEEMMEGAYCVS